MLALQRLLDIMTRLRDPHRGCPWDKEQTFATLVPHTLEEAYEVATAIEDGDYAALREELGDLLFQVVFYAQLAKEQGWFDFEDVARAISDKLQRRHPHVFSDAVIADSRAQTEHWEQLKAQERASKAELPSNSVVDGIAKALPALSYAQKLQKRAARVGFDWPNYQGVLEKINEELSELDTDWTDAQKRQEELGDVLFSCVNLARHAEVDAETALREANRKFILRFRCMETVLREQGLSMTSADATQREAAWVQAKQRSSKTVGG